MAGVFCPVPDLPAPRTSSLPKTNKTSFIWDERKKRITCPNHIRSSRSSLRYGQNGRVLPTINSNPCTFLSCLLPPSSIRQRRISCFVDCAGSIAVVPPWGRCYRLPPKPNKYNTNNTKKKIRINKATPKTGSPPTNTNKASFTGVWEKT